MTESEVTAAEPAATAAPETARALAGTDDTRKWVRWAGIAFAVLFLAGWLLATFAWSDDASDQEVVGWYADGGNRIRQIGGAYLTVLAGVAFVVFSTGLARLIPRASVAQLFRSLSLLFSGLVLAGIAAIANASASVEFPGFDPPENAETLRLMEGLGFGMVLLGGAISAGIAVVLASYGLRGTGVIPNWLVVAGYVAGALLALIGVIYVPLVLLVAWTLAVALTVRRGATA